MTNRIIGTTGPIRLLIVEDSPSVREFLVYLFASDQEIRVIATANDGEEALAAVRDRSPDVITMDLHMPKMDGYAATRAIMESFPTPIVIVTGSTSAGELATTINALEAGALAVVKRPYGIQHPDYAKTARELIQTVKLMSEVKVVKRWTPRKKTTSLADKPMALEAGPNCPQIRLVAIGSSTGGPQALQQILAKLPKNFHAPILIVQHIAAGFTEGLAQWLAEAAGFPVEVATDGQQILPGRAYLAPNGFQTTVDGHGRIALLGSGPENGHLPSVSALFRSVGTAYGANAVAVLLTGMGRDGAVELGLMKANGAVTIAQDMESCIVHGMPGAAIELGGATYVLPPEKIAAMLTNLTNNRKLEKSPWHQ